MTRIRPGRSRRDGPSREKTDAVLFCPFCRESFEGERSCPEHELALVRFDRLPSEVDDAVPDEHEPVAAYDPGLGRGWVMVGAILLIIAPAFPFITTVAGEDVTVTGYQLALARAMNLWMVPCVGIALVGVLLRRRSPAAMRGARLVAPLLGLIAASAVGYTWWRVHLGVPELAAQLGVEVTVRPEVGMWLTGLGILLVMFGGFRLGVVATPVRFADVS